MATQPDKPNSEHDDLRYRESDGEEEKHDTELIDRVAFALWVGAYMISPHEEFSAVGDDAMSAFRAGWKTHLEAVKKDCRDFAQRILKAYEETK